MRIVVDTVAGTAEVEDADDLQAFSVHVAGDGAIGPALGDLGRADANGQHAWIGIDELRRRAEPARSDGWGERFDGMVGFARSKGWLDDDGDALRAHIVRSGS
jgi:hypothetical protein